MGSKLWMTLRGNEFGLTLPDRSNLGAIPLDCLSLYEKSFPNFIKNYENHKFLRWLTSSQKNKHQFLIKNLMFSSHSPTCQKHEGNRGLVSKAKKSNRKFVPGKQRWGRGRQFLWKKVTRAKQIRIIFGQVFLFKDWFSNRKVEWFSPFQ